MSLVVGVHGIAQQYTGSNTLSGVWLPALKDGLEAAGYKRLGDSLQDADLGVAFFGSLFRPHGVMGAGYAPVKPADLSSEAELDLVSELYAAAVEQQPELGRPVDALGGPIVGVQVMVERLLRSRTLGGFISERALVGDLKQVVRFLADFETKDRVLERVHRLVNETETRVMIGHSLGSIVAYEYLCRFRPPGVRLLITLGSPLGIRNVVFDRLTPAPDLAGGSWPGNVSRWVNIADSRDIVALRKDLADLFVPLPGGDPIEDRLVDNGKKPHSVQRYLTAAETGFALASALE